MDNFLDNGAVLPSGLLSVDDSSTFGAFQKKYQNSYLRTGIVTATYDIADPNNANKVVPEYDVLVSEQNEDESSTLSYYRNCTASTGFGSPADFFEARLRALTKLTGQQQTTTPSPSGQNGAIVLLLCLNGFSGKGIIISCLLHPDRTTTLNGSGPHLEGEYNGVNVVVNTDGSTALTFNGATDNSGNIIDSTQGTTVIQIDKDGSVQMQHSTVTFRLDRSGVVTMTAKGDVNVNCANANVVASDTATVDGTTVKLGADAAESVIKGDTFQALYNAHTHPTILGPTLQPIIPMPPNALSTKVITE